MDNIRQSSLSIGQLRSKFSERVFAIPELQREFVWNAKKACGLLDSIYKKLPIGMAMVWETARQNGNEIRQELSVLPPFDDVRNKG